MKPAKVPGIPPQLPLDAARDLMDLHRIDHLPVVEARHCVGLLSGGDIDTAEPPGDPTVPVVAGEACRRPPPVVQLHAMSDSAGPVVVLDGVRVIGVLEGAEP